MIMYIQVIERAKHYFQHGKSKKLDGAHEKKISELCIVEVTCFHLRFQFQSFYFLLTV